MVNCQGYAIVSNNHVLCHSTHRLYSNEVPVACLMRINFNNLGFVLLSEDKSFREPTGGAHLASVSP